MPWFLLAVLDVFGMKFKAIASKYRNYSVKK